MAIRSRYSERLRVALDFSDAVSMTRQSHKEECDINTILSRYSLGGLVSKRRDAFFADVSEVPTDFREALDLVDSSRRAFLQLPSQLRARFGNDPAQLLDFLRDPANREEAIELGLLEKPVPPEAPAPVVAAEPVAPAPEA